MLKYIILILFVPNWILAETWRCEISLSNNGRGNINEQKIYTKHHNYYLKSSQFGDKKLQILEDNDDALIINAESTNFTLSVTLDRRDQTFIEREIDRSGLEINKVEGICNVSQ
jgi:hypothetical protein